MAKIPDLHSQPLGTANHFKATRACLTGMTERITGMAGGITTRGDAISDVIPGMNAIAFTREVRALLASLEGCTDARC